MLDREQFRIPVRLAVAALLATGLTLAPTMARAASDDGVFIVTSTGDGGDATTVSNCAAGAGECTLRGAILAANAHPNLAAGPDAITFSIPGPQPHTIAPTSALPVLTDTVTVDAGLPATPWAPRSVELTGRACNPGGILCDGLVVDAPDTTIRGFAIHEFFAGVRNLFGQGDGLVVEGNFIGTEPTGSLPAQRPFVPTSNGVLLDHISRARIGGDPGVGRGNLIAGHAFAEVNGIFATQLQVLGNRLGIAADGTTSLGAGWDVRLESSPDSRVGTAASPNVMAGPVTASGAAVELVNTPGTSVQGNLIGVDASGSVRTGVGGISVQSDHVLVGGAGQGNVISGGIGVRLQSNPATRESGGNVVSHNLIGTDVAGLVAIPNGVGVTLSDSGSTVEDNLISGNTGDGIAMLSGAGGQHRIVRNRIGVAADGSPLGNGRFGMGAQDFYGAGGTVIGGSPGDGNTIAYNGYHGVDIAFRGEAPGEPTPRGVTVRYNSIHDNGSREAPALGINLPGDLFSNGPDGIDDLDADAGANDLQNAPEILSATTTAEATVVNGRLRSTPGERFDIDLYDNNACDETGYGEAERFLSTQPVTTADGTSDAPGLVTFSFTITPPLPFGHVVATTATNANGSTSELSQCGAPLPGARVVYTGPDTGTYSDPIQLSGRLETVTEPSQPIAGKQLSFVLGDLAPVAAGPTGDTGRATTQAFAVTLVPGTQTVTTSFAGDDTYNQATDTDQVEIRKEDCTLAYTGATTETAGTIDLRAQFGEDDDSPGDWTGHTVDFAVHDNQGGATHHLATTNALGVASVEVQLDSDARSVGASFDGDDFYNACATAADTDLAVTPDATTVTYTGPLTGTYSDPITLGGRLETSTEPRKPVTGRNLGITLGSMPEVATGATDTSGSASASPMPITLAPDDYHVVTRFAGDAAYAAATDTDTVRVEREDCTLAYTGDTLVTPLSSTALRAQFGEADSSPGDWSGHDVEFFVVDTSMVVTRYPATTAGNGVAEGILPLPANVYSVGVQFAGDRFYKPCGTAEDTLLTVQQAGAKVTGGGWVSNSVGRTSFGFNLVPQAGGAWTSQFQVRGAGKSTFHGSGPASATVLSRTSVSWSGQGRWNGATGYRYTITVTDNGSSGAKRGDVVDISIYPTGDPAHPLLGTGSQALKGGNITVH